MNSDSTRNVGLAYKHGWGIVRVAPQATYMSRLLRDKSVSMIRVSHITGCVTKVGRG